MGHEARLEFLVEPFVIAAPGPHVLAAVEVAAAAGLSPDMGPFATTAGGDLDMVIDVVGDLLRAGFANGASSVQVHVATGSERRLSGLHDALDRMVTDVEREFGMALSDMNRADKQRAVARLEAHGAFLLRGSVETIALAMGVSKVTLYAYLNAVTDQ